MADAMAIPAVRERLSAWLAKDQKRLAAMLRAAGVASPGAHAAHMLSAVMGSFSLHALQVPGVPKGYAAQQLLAWLDAVAG